MAACMLTTSDNPFNCFENWNSWFSYDEQMGYGTCEYLARIARTSSQLSDAENEEEIERAIDEILLYNSEIGQDSKGNSIYYVKVFENENNKSKKVSVS